MVVCGEGEAPWAKPGLGEAPRAALQTGLALAGWDNGGSVFLSCNSLIPGQGSGVSSTSPARQQERGCWSHAE